MNSCTRALAAVDGGHVDAEDLRLKLDSSHQRVQQMLANLYAQRSGGNPHEPPPAAPGDEAPRRRAAPQPRPPPDAPVRAAMYIDLTPEIDEALARDEASVQPPPPPAPEAPEAPESMEDIQVEFDLEDAGD